MLPGSHSKSSTVWLGAGHVTWLRGCTWSTAFARSEKDIPLKTMSFRFKSLSRLPLAIKNAPAHTASYSQKLRNLNYELAEYACSKNLTYQSLEGSFIPEHYNFGALNRFCSHIILCSLVEFYKIIAYSVNLEQGYGTRWLTCHFWLADPQIYTEHRFYSFEHSNDSFGAVSFTI